MVTRQKLLIMVIARYEAYYFGRSMFKDSPSSGMEGKFKEWNVVTVNFILEYGKYLSRDPKGEALVANESRSFSVRQRLG